ncbi:hypothetical protein Ancab_004281 [Ancistrocladus abbreviatus]
MSDHHRSSQIVVLPAPNSTVSAECQIQATDKILDWSTAMDNSGLFHGEDGEDLKMSPCASDGGKFQHLVANKRGDSCQTVEVVIALALTVVLGVGNRVLYKLALVPLKQYPCFLAQLATFGFVNSDSHPRTV